MVKRAFILQEAGSYLEAAALLETASSTNAPETDLFAAYLSLGNLYWRQLGQLDKALSALRHAVRVKPGLALASLAIFNCLLDADDPEGALKEGERFFEGRWRAAPGTFLKDKSDVGDPTLVSDYRREVLTYEVSFETETTGFEVDDGIFSYETGSVVRQLEKQKGNERLHGIPRSTSERRSEC